MGMRTLEVMGMLVAAPQILLPVVGNEQAFAMMPAIAEDIIVLLCFGGTFFFTQTIPFAVRMLDDAFRHQGRGQHAIAGGLEEKTVVDIHQPIETETLIDAPNFGQYGSAKGQKIPLDRVYIGTGGFAKFAQIVCHQTIGANYATIAVGQRLRQRLPDIAIDFDGGIHQHNIAAPTGAHSGIAPGSKTDIMIGEEYLQRDALALVRYNIATASQLLQIGQCVIGRAVLDNDQFNRVAADMTHNALNGPFQVGAA